MLSELRPRSIATQLWNVEKNLSEADMDDEFGVLPGEQEFEEVGLESEMNVEERLVEEGRVMEGLEDGFVMEGVWTQLRVAGDGDGNDDRLAMFARDRLIMELGAVMDRDCVEIVRMVWKDGRMKQADRVASLKSREYRP